MHNFFRFKSYLTYWLDAVDEHSLHSPFFYDFYTKVLHTPAEPGSEAAVFEKKRADFLREETTLAVDDLGGGAAHLPHRRAVRYIAATSLSPARLSRLYQRLARHFYSKHIIELGTSLGINALYLSAVPGTRVTTFEGAPAIAARARALFAEFPQQAIFLHEGDLNATLPTFLSTVSHIDLALIDANHRYEPTVRYAQQVFQKTHARSIVIIDDIHHAPGMEKAWHELRRHPLVYASADLYRCGLLFFDPSLNKQHVVLQF